MDFFRIIIEYIERIIAKVIVNLSCRDIADPKDCIRNIANDTLFIFR